MQKITSKRMGEFIAALQNSGGSAGNGNLRKTLDWEEEFYWKVQGKLIELGKIVAGRGKGGSVRFTEAQATESGMEVSEPASAAPLPLVRERGLYPAIKASIESKWIKRFALDDVLVDETHSRGSKDTGGTFTRPDITAAGIRRYVYLPKRLEIVTVEIKPSDALSIIGILEAIAHREAAHRAYVFYATSRALFDSAPESERIMELAQKYGIGVVLVEQPGDVESWEILLDALRHEPDPARLDRFLNDLPSEDMKRQLSKWKE
ncbi:hypothetical protein KXR53_33990 [Inquilinus limosus]|uniref:hypothetical protein n=1 Tax=Inquilinus limosus TaxID=171674 RepID=UPI003F15455F